MSNLASRLFVGGLQEYIAALRPFAPLLHLIWVLLFALIFTRANRVRRLFAGAVAVGYVYFAAMPFAWIILRLHAKTGGAIYQQDFEALKVLLDHCILGAVVCLLLAALWLIEALRPRNDYETATVPQWRWWVMPFFLWALWYPLSPGFPVHQDLGIEGLLFSPFGLLPGATSLALLCLFAICRDVNRLLVTGASLLILILTFFVEPRWWVSIPQYILALYCLAFWSIPAVITRYKTRSQSTSEEPTDG